MKFIKIYNQNQPIQISQLRIMLTTPPTISVLYRYSYWAADTLGSRSPQSHCHSLPLREGESHPVHKKRSKGGWLDSLRGKKLGSELNMLQKADVGQDLTMNAWELEKIKGERLGDIKLDRFKEFRPVVERGNWKAKQTPGGGTASEVGN